MKTIKYCTILFFIYSSAVAQVKKQTGIYVLKYYYAEDTTKVLFKRAYNRSMENDGSFCLVDYDPVNLHQQSYTSCYGATGVPTSIGSGKDEIKISHSSVSLNFRGKDTTIQINTADLMKDPSSLWFWKYQPKINESCTVAGVRKNFITNKIDIVKVTYTYLGDEKINVLDKITDCHKVKSVPLNGSTGVYDERWFDNDGMLVKEHHVVGNNGMRVGQLVKIVTTP